jgi:hypothetical protein
MKRAYFVCLFQLLTATFLLSQSNPVPLIDQPLVPNAAAPGSPGLTLVINGAGFVSTSVVNWNGAPLSTSFVSVDKLQADVPASNLASAGTAYVTVSSPAPGGGTSDVATTTTVTASPSPSVAGQNVKFKAMVNSPTVVPIGTVTFTARTKTLGTGSLAGGKASLITSALPAGTTTVTATYNGTSNITGSSGAVVQTVK